MRKSKTIPYCSLLLAGVLTVGALSMATGTSQARYTTVASSQLLLRQAQTEVKLTSDVLAPGGQTVELGRLEVSESLELTVNMKAEGGTASGTLLFEENNYLTASCPDTIDGGEGIFHVTLTPTTMAQGLLNEMTTTLRVSWNENLWADLRVTLVPGGTAGEEDQPGAAGDDFLTGMTEFDPNALLALQIAVPEGSDSIVLRGLPEKTRYSTDGGRTYTMLYYGGSGWLTPAGETVTVLLDFADGEWTEPVTVTAEAFDGDVSLGVSEWTAAPDERLIAMEDDASPLIVGQAALDLGLPTNSGGAELYYTLTRPDGTIENMPLIADVDGSLVIDPMNNGVQAPAGTYLLDINWDYQGATVAARKLTFYINYCSYVQPSSILAADDSTEATATGGNVS